MLLIMMPLTLWLGAFHSGRSGTVFILTWQVSVPPDREPAQIMLLLTRPPYASELLQMLEGMISTCAAFNTAEVLPLMEDGI